jgi:hypothetical protein
MRLSSGSQATENGSMETTKKRKLQTPGRPIGAVNKAKTITKDTNSQSIFSFTSQTQQPGFSISQAYFGKTKRLLGLAALVLVSS